MRGVFLAAEEESRAEIESESEARCEDPGSDRFLFKSRDREGDRIPEYQKDPDGAANVVGTLSDGSACEILETLDGWVKISSGKLRDMQAPNTSLTGDEAKEAAKGPREGARLYYGG